MDGTVEIRGTLWLYIMNLYAHISSGFPRLKSLVIRFKEGQIAAIKMDRVGFLSEFQKICVDWHRMW